MFTTQKIQQSWFGQFLRGSGCHQCFVRRETVIVIAVILALLVSTTTVAFFTPNFLSLYGKISSQETGLAYTATQTTGPTYPSPEQICSILPKTAIGNVTANHNSSHAYILIIEADIGSSYEGINGSAFHQNTRWPVFTVYRGQTVTIHALNCPSSPEPHGLAIGYYYPSGTILKPGQAATFTFVANTSGNFTVFDNIFSAINQFTQNGLMIVSNSSMNNPN